MNTQNSFYRYIYAGLWALVSFIPAFLSVVLLSVLGLTEGFIYMIAALIVFFVSYLKTYSYAKRRWIRKNPDTKPIRKRTGIGGFVIMFFLWPIIPVILGALAVFGIPILIIGVIVAFVYREKIKAIFSSSKSAISSKVEDIKDSVENFNLNKVNTDDSTVIRKDEEATRIKDLDLAYDEAIKENTVFNKAQTS